MSDFDDAPRLRLRAVRGRVFARYVLEVDVSHVAAGTVQRRPIRWWHPLLRSDVSQEIEPGRFTVLDAQGVTRAVIVRRGGVAHAGELAITGPDGRPIGTMRRAGPRLHQGYVFHDPAGTALGWTVAGEGRVATGHGPDGAPIGSIRRISPAGLLDRRLGRDTSADVYPGPGDSLRAADPQQQGVSIDLAPTASPVLRLMLVAAAIQLR